VKPASLDSTGAHALPLPRLALWSAYVGFWLAAGVFQAIAELQHYLQRGGAHPWEPFLWELSSTIASGLLTVAIFRWHRFLFEYKRPPLSRLAGHLAGAVAYVGLHSGLMYGLRALVYASIHMAYEPGNPTSILSYEGAKDFVSYVVIVGVCHGVLLFLRDREQRIQWARLNAELAAARIARLQEQIQPHFLFNTLNLVSSVMYEDVERADRILSELAELLRLSIDAGRHQTHSLSAEMRLVEPFLSIMRQRFEGRLSAQIVVTDAAGVCEFPSLLLMAPVENAVKHGVAQSAAPVAIRVSADVANGRLEVAVSDSAGHLSGDSRPDGTGLSNTRDRLAALYGDAAVVSLTREGSDTVFRMRLPAKVAT
jgi:hypothetical protein